MVKTSFRLRLLPAKFFMETTWKYHDTFYWLNSNMEHKISGTTAGVRATANIRSLSRLEPNRFLGLQELSVTRTGIPATDCATNWFSFARIAQVSRVD
jgi:hypothetical protein